MSSADSGRLLPVIVAIGDVEVGRWPPPTTPVDLAVVDRLARLALAARRRGVALRLHDATPELVEVLGFVGVAFETIADPESPSSPG